VTIRRQGTYAIAGLKGALITGDVTSTAGTDRKSSYEVVRRLDSDGVWRVTSGTGSSHQEESASTKYADGTGSVASPSWDTATETLKNSKALTKRVWFNTNSTIDTATGTWKTTGDGGSESSGVVEITFSGEHQYNKLLDVATAMTLTTSGTYSQTIKATRDYDFSTKSGLAASGVITTTGTGTASRTDTTHTWWNAGDKDATLTAPNGATVTHTEHGDRNETTTVATDWVFAGGGWREKSTNLSTNNASNGGFASGYKISWQPTGSLDQASVDHPYSEGSLIQTASGSHDYTSSSDLTRTALAGGGFKVTGSREGGGASHGTSSVHFYRHDSWPYEESENLDADDSFDYTGDNWTITFGDTGMPSITYAGTLTTSEVFSTSATVDWGGWRGSQTDGPAPLSETKSRTRSSVADPAPAFAISGGRDLQSNGFWTTRLGSFFEGYGNSYDVARAGYGYDESKTVPGAFGGSRAPEAATQPETPSGASTVPKDINSEATNYEARLAGLTSPRLVTSGSRPLGSGSANLPAMPKISTPAIGDLGFEKSDSAPEAPTTKPFNTIVVSGMAGPVGAMASSGGSWFDYDKFSAWAHTGLSVGGAVPVLGIFPDAIDFVFTAAEIPFGKSTTTDLGFATAGVLATAFPGGDQAVGLAKVARVTARNADEALAAGKTIGNVARTEGHHTIPKAIQTKLPPSVRTHPDVVGRVGNPNVRQIPADIHRRIHSSAPGNYYPGGDYNRRFDELIRERGGYTVVSPRDVNQIRDQLVEEFGL